MKTIINKILNILQNYVKGMIDTCKRLPLPLAILFVIAIIVLPDPLIALGSIVIERIKTMV